MKFIAFGVLFSTWSCGYSLFFPESTYALFSWRANYSHMDYVTLESCHRNQDPTDIWLVEILDNKINVLFLSCEFCRRSVHCHPGLLCIEVWQRIEALKMTRRCSLDLAKLGNIFSDVKTGFLLSQWIFTKTIESFYTFVTASQSVPSFIMTRMNEIIHYICTFYILYFATFVF